VQKAIKRAAAPNHVSTDGPRKRAALQHHPLRGSHSPVRRRILFVHPYIKYEGSYELEYYMVLMLFYFLLAYVPVHRYGPTFD
jgi:hypothetical protein